MAGAPSPMVLGSGEEHLGNALPTSGVVLRKTTELHEGTDGKLSKLLTVGLDELENRLTHLVGHILTVEDTTRMGNVVDPDPKLVTVMEPKVEVETAGHERLEVLGILVLALINKGLEIQIGNKNHCPIELEGLRDILFLQLRSLLHVRDLAGRRGIAQRLEDVKSILIIENRICIIEHDDRPRLAIAIGKHVQMDSRQGPTNNLMGHIGLLKNLLDRVGLAHAGGTSHHQRTDVLSHGTLGQKRQDVEPLLQVRQNLPIGASRLLVLLSLTLSDHLLGGTTTLHNLDAHVATPCLGKDGKGTTLQTESQA